MLSYSSQPFTKYFSKTHEWIDLVGNTGMIGISKHAEHLLGEISLIDVKKNASIKKGQSLGEIESSKATSPIISPMSGKIIEVNSKIDSDPTIINKSPEQNGWIARIIVDDPSDTRDLMDEAAYKKFLSSSK